MQPNSLGRVRAGTLLIGLRLPVCPVGQLGGPGLHPRHTHCGGEEGLGDSHSEQAQGTSWKKPPLECEVEYRWPWLGFCEIGEGERGFAFALQWVWVRSSC